MNAHMDTTLIDEMACEFEHYASHINILQKSIAILLEKCSYDGLLIHSGELLYGFLDDQSYPFRVNPLFNHWLPITDVANCWLLVDGVHKPKLWFYSPVDYWHKIERMPNAEWTEAFDIQLITNADDIVDIIHKLNKNLAYLGSSLDRATKLGLSQSAINPKQVIDYLHYHRSIKTEYELACMRKAQAIAVEGHIAAQQAFMMGLSEYEINAAYLLATEQRDNDVPYSNIVAINQNASILHYTKLNKLAPESKRSFLLDAGAQYLGYAADLTRTISYEEDEFSGLIKTMNQHQLDLIANIKVGMRYTDLQIDMDRRIAEMLLDFQIVKSLSIENIMTSGISRSFMPHGIGHPLGLQVHDVAGFMQDDNGTHLSPPEIYPYLRCTRVIEPGMVLTIEPGFYFIDCLLNKWIDTEYQSNFNWRTVAHLKTYGGIRIEDNIIIKTDGIENMTRDLALP